MKPFQRQLAIEPVIFCGIIIAFLVLTKVIEFPPLVLTDTLWTLAALVTALRCFHTANRLAGSHRQAWNYLGAANLSWFIGMLIWGYQELVLGVMTPFPSLADLGFLGFAVIFIPGLMKMQPERQHWSPTLVQISLIGILFSCLAMVHITMFSGLLSATEYPSLYLMTALCYPVLYMSVLLFGITNQWRISRQPGSHQLLVLGFAIHAITDSFYAYNLLGHSYRVGNFIDVLWLIGFLLIYEAARHAAKAADGLPQNRPLIDRAKWESMIAPVGMLLVVLVAYRFQNNLSESTFKYGLPFALLLVMFIAIREMATLRVELDARRLVMDNQKKLATLLETIPYGVQENDLEGRITFSNRAHHQILGYPDGSLVGHYIWDMQPTEADKEKLRADLKYLIEVQPPPSPYITVSRRADNGAVLGIRVDWAYKRDDDGKLIGFTSIISDITAQQHAQEELKQAAAVFENTDEAVIITDASGNITSVNRAFVEITGYTSDEAMGKNPRILRSHRHDESFYNDMWSEIKKHGLWRGEIWNRRKNGEIFPVWQTVSAIHADGGVSHYVAVFSDITAIKESQEKLDFLAYHDPLTALPNRLLMQDRLKQAMEHANREGCQIAVILIDLDHFKNVNDSLGHLIGDELLKIVAMRLSEQIRKEDTVARLGGDEFVVILGDIHGIEDAAKLARKFNQTFEQPTLIGSHHLHVTLSIGIALYPKDGTDVATLIKHADTALYRSKVTGRNNFHFYTEGLTAAALKRLTLESELRRAINAGEFVIYYQPLIDLGSGRMSGAEALIRWQHPSQGIVLPEEFLAIAEETRLINLMGEWVLQESCLQFQRWRAQGHSLQRLAVNIAHAQFHQDGLADIVNAALRNSGLPAECLELEISENFMMERDEKTLSRVEFLKALGVSLAIDDFGTGYSSLNYLKRLPLDRLKIDRSFVHGLPDDGHDTILCKAIIGLAHNLGLSVIAEGVETEGQKESLVAMGCNEAQGFLYGAAMPLEDMDRRLGSLKNSSAGGH